MAQTCSSEIQLCVPVCSTISCEWFHDNDLYFTLAVCTTPCQNGGTCTSYNTCLCPFGFAGLQCQSNFSLNIISISKYYWNNFTSIPACVNDFQGGNWMLVRRVQQGSTWHPVKWVIKTSLLWCNLTKSFQRLSSRHSRFCLLYTSDAANE